MNFVSSLVEFFDANVALPLTPRPPVLSGFSPNRFGRLSLTDVRTRTLPCPPTVSRSLRKESWDFWTLSRGSVPLNFVIFVKSLISLLFYFEPNPLTTWENPLSRDSLLPPSLRVGEDIKCGRVYQLFEKTEGNCSCGWSFRVSYKRGLILFFQ